MKKVLLIIIHLPINIIKVLFMLATAGLQKLWFYIFKEATFSAIKRANKRRKATGYKYVVMKVGGWPRIYRRKDIKSMYLQHKFKKGMSLDEVLRNALYVTS